MTFGNIMTEVTTLFATSPEVPLLMVAGGVVALTAFFWRRTVRAAR